MYQTGLQRKARTGEGSYRAPDHLASACVAWRGRKLLSQPEILEEIAAVGFHRHAALRAAMASASATVSRAISACSSSTMRPSSAMAPLPLFSGRSNAAMILRAAAISYGDGANTVLHGSICEG